MAEDINYYLAVRENLLRAFEDPAIIKNTMDEMATLQVERVLDLGCGIGQALFPMAALKGAFGVGVDVSNAGLLIGREIFNRKLPEARVTFTRTVAESLPFAAESFDLVNCGLALPYMDNSRAIAEVARVLRPGGVFLLKIHHARFYLRELWKGLTGGHLLQVIYITRVLVAGTVYHLLRRQPQGRILNESFQTRWLLRRETAKQGLTIEREQAGTNQLTPSFVIRKKISSSVAGV